MSTNLIDIHCQKHPDADVGLIFFYNELGNLTDEAVLCRECSEVVAPMQPLGYYNPFASQLTTESRTQPKKRGEREAHRE